MRFLETIAPRSSEKPEDPAMFSEQARLELANNGFLICELNPREFRPELEEILDNRNLDWINIPDARLAEEARTSILTAEYFPTQVAIKPDCLAIPNTENWSFREQRAAIKNSQRLVPDSKPVVPSAAALIEIAQKHRELTNGQILPADQAKVITATRIVRHLPWLQYGRLAIAESEGKLLVYSVDPKQEFASARLPLVFMPR